MAETWRRRWRELASLPPGSRFRTMHERHQERTRGRPLARWGAVGLGAVLLAGGVVLLFIPGPGIPAIALGAALIAGESKTAACLLDRAEMKARAWTARLAARHRS